MGKLIQFPSTAQQDRAERLRVSLDKINRLMAELKKLTKQEKEREKAKRSP